MWQLVMVRNMAKDIGGRSEMALRGVRIYEKKTRERFTVGANGGTGSIYG